MRGSDGAYVEGAPPFHSGQGGCAHVRQDASEPSTHCHAGPVFTAPTQARWSPVTALAHTIVQFTEPSAATYTHKKNTKFAGVPSGTVAQRETCSGSTHDSSFATPQLCVPQSVPWLQLSQGVRHAQGQSSLRSLRARTWAWAATSHRSRCETKRLGPPSTGPLQGTGTSHSHPLCMRRRSWSSQTLTRPPGENRTCPLGMPQCTR